jgi:hypothetical protein
VPTVLAKNLAAVFRMTRTVLSKELLFRRYRLFSAGACRRLWPLLNEDGRRAVNIIEQYAGHPDKNLLSAALVAANRSHAAAVETHLLVELTGNLRTRLEALAPVLACSAVKEATNSRASVVGRVSSEASTAVGAVEVVRRLPAEPALTYNDARRSPAELAAQASLFRDIFGNPFHPVSFSPDWRTETVTALATGMYDARDFTPMPVLADALEGAGCHERKGR